MNSKQLATSLKQIKDELSTEKKQLKSKLKKLNQTEKKIQEISVLLDSRQYCTLFRRLQAKWICLENELAQDLINYVQVELKSFWKSYPILLEDAFMKADLALDKSSRHPHYGIADSLLQIEIDETKCLAKISSLAGKTFSCPADVNAVCALVKTNYQRLTKFRFSPQQFLKKLHSAYEKTKIEHNNLQFVPIKKVFSHFTRKKYTIDEFAMDFSRLLQSNLKRFGEEYLEIQHSKDDKNGIMLYGLSQRLLIGAICFKGKKNE